jgi:hypothetical protein
MVHHTYFVPVHGTTSQRDGTLALRTGRLLSGERIGLAFTCEASLLLALGPGQEWIRLDEEALSDMLMPLGVEHIRVDPRPAAELQVPSAGRSGRPGPEPQGQLAPRPVPQAAFLVFLGRRGGLAVPRANRSWPSAGRPGRRVLPG